ncbi:hypothetical protein SSS_06736 [Sarcoptes scabiei]|nr:hypothetical protein SSS_06736 [Sarcoptes scabiei]
MDLSDTINDTINQIKQIENEIVFSLNKNHMKKFEPKKNEKNLVSYCDLLLENIRKQILWTEEYNNLNPSTEDKIELNKLTENSIQKHSNLEQEPVKKSEDLHSINLSNLSAHLKDSENHQDLKFDDDNLATNDETKSKKFFPNEFRSYETDYRISFYDNSNKFLIYFHNSKLVDTMCEDFCHLNDQSSCVNFSKLQIENNGRILPDYIENALLYLMKNGLNSIGIFRKSGVKSRINILKEQINQNIPIDFINSCVYDVADLVKNWLRELKPRLLTVELIDLFIKKEKTFNLWHLNDSHRYLLFTVLKFLSVVGSFHRQNQMNSSNLAICFAPSICDGENAKQIHRAQQCLQFCIENFESLFSPSVLGDDCGRISDDNNSNSNHHTSVLIINASPIDILHRLLYQRLNRQADIQMEHRKSNGQQ